MTACVFEREKKAYALIWHNTGSAKAEIDLCDATYEKEIGKPMAIEKRDGKIRIEVCEAAYLSSSVSLDTLTEALKNAKKI